MTVYNTNTISIGQLKYIRTKYLINMSYLDNLTSDYDKIIIKLLRVLFNLFHQIEKLWFGASLIPRIVFLKSSTVERV